MSGNRLHAGSIVLAGGARRSGGSRRVEVRQAPRGQGRHHGRRRGEVTRAARSARAPSQHPLLVTSQRDGSSTAPASRQANGREAPISGFWRPRQLRKRAPENRTRHIRRRRGHPRRDGRNGRPAGRCSAASTFLDGGTALGGCSRKPNLRHSFVDAGRRRRAEVTFGLQVSEFQVSEFGRSR